MRNTLFALPACDAAARLADHLVAQPDFSEPQRLEMRTLGGRALLWGNRPREAAAAYARLLAEDRGAPEHVRAEWLLGDSAALRCRSGAGVVIAVAALAIAASDLVASLPVFHSPYNWFHLAG